MDLFDAALVRLIHDGVGKVTAGVVALAASRGLLLLVLLGRKLGLGGGSAPVERRVPRGDGQRCQGVLALVAAR